MSKDVGYDVITRCYVCGKLNAFDFCDFYICDQCIENNLIEPDEEIVRLADELVEGV